MWKYVQSTGSIFDPSGQLVETGYSGKGDAKNDPDQQCAVDTGPIPRGAYAIGAAIDHPKLGKIALPLAPDPSNNMCGRSDFYIHGDKVSDPGNASEGCIIMSKSTRQTIDGSDDKRLSVVRESRLDSRVRTRKGKKRKQPSARRA